jgi:hypothetical protein
MGCGKTAGNVALVVTVLGCLAVLTISIYPGVLNDLVLPAIFLSFFAIPLVAIIGLATLIVLARRGGLKNIKIPWRRAAAVAVVLFAACLMLGLDVPRRIAFAVSRSKFEQLLSQAPKSDRQGAPLNQRLGIYYVDEYVADPRGGVFFRVHCGSDGIGPDRMSYGFAHAPNRKGTPFGAAHYRLFELGNEWYWFRASDDWY